MTPLHLQPALRYLGWEAGSLPETERASRDNLALPLWAGIDSGTQERVVAAVRAGGLRRGERRDQPASALAARRRRRPRSSPPGTSPSASASTRRDPAVLRDAALDGRSRSSSWSSSPIFVALRLLQPLVAVRVDPRHVGAPRAASRSPASSRASSSTSPRPSQQIRLPRSVAIMDWLLLLAFVAGSRHARAHDHRAARARAASSLAARR